MSRTSIAWTNESWNPLEGERGMHHCERISPGCTNCYAERMNLRGMSGKERLPYRVGVDEARLNARVLEQPFHWRKPRLVFPGSMTDMFGEWVKDEWIAAIFGVMAACPQHTFQALTKRAERLPRWFEWMSRSEAPVKRATWCATNAIWTERDGDPPEQACLSGVGGPMDPRPWPLPNAWIGVSVESPDYLWRIDHLRRVPAAVRWMSLEPLLAAPGDLSPYLPHRFNREPHCEHCEDCVGRDGWQDTREDSHGPFLDWVVVGGESGPNARPCEVEWIADVVRQCAAAGVACFVKQDSGPRSGMQGRIHDALWAVKQFPEVPR